MDKNGWDDEEFAEIAERVRYRILGDRAMEVIPYAMLTKSKTLKELGKIDTWIVAHDRRSRIYFPNEVLEQIIKKAGKKLYAGEGMDNFLTEHRNLTPSQIAQLLYTRAEVAYQNALRRGIHLASEARGRRYSETELTQIVQESADCFDREIAERIGRSVSAVQQRRKRLGIRKMKSRVPWRKRPDLRQYVIKYYKRKQYNDIIAELKKMAPEYEFNKWVVGGVLYRAGLKKRESRND